MSNDDLTRIAVAAEESVQHLPGTYINRSNNKLHITNMPLRMWITVEQTPHNQGGGLFSVHEYRIGDPIKVVATCAWEVITWIQRRIFEGVKK